MQAHVDQFFCFVAAERISHGRRLRFALFMCILILALLYRTEWIVLRPGLAILLAGQAGVAIALFFRNDRLRRTLDRQKTGVIQEDSMSAWFEGEESFSHRLASFETALQMAGFLVLGYEFWVTSRSLWLALAIGVVYPAVMYLGINRRKHAKSTRALRATKRQIAMNFHKRNDTGD